MRRLPNGRFVEDKAALRAAWAEQANELAPLRYEPDTESVERQRFGGDRTVGLVDEWLGQRPPREMMATAEDAADMNEAPDNPDTSPPRTTYTTAALDWPHRDLWQPWTAKQLETAERFEAYLRSLRTEGHRDAIKTLYFTWMTQEEAAASLGLTRGGFRSRIEKALASLRTIVPEPSDHGPPRAFRTDIRCRRNSGRVPKWCRGHFIQQRCAGHPLCITILPQHSNPWVVCRVYQARGGHDLPINEGAT